MSRLWTDAEGRGVLSLDDLHLAMLNWGRWSRANDERLGIPPPPAFQDYRASAAWEPGWGDRGAPDALPMPIDERLAVEYETALVRLSPQHRRVLKRHYFLRAPQPELERNEALRALGDVRLAAMLKKSLMDSGVL